MSRNKKLSSLSLKKNKVTKKNDKTNVTKKKTTNGSPKADTKSLPKLGENILKKLKTNNTSIFPENAIIQPQISIFDNSSKIMDANLDSSGKNNNTKEEKDITCSSLSLNTSDASSTQYDNKSTKYEVFSEKQESLNVSDFDVVIQNISPCTKSTSTQNSSNLFQNSISESSNHIDNNITGGGLKKIKFDDEFLFSDKIAESSSSLQNKSSKEICDKEVVDNSNTSICIENINFDDDEITGNSNNTVLSEGFSKINKLKAKINKQEIIINALVNEIVALKRKTRNVDNNNESTKINCSCKEKTKQVLEESKTRFQPTINNEDVDSATSEVLTSKTNIKTELFLQNDQPLKTENRQLSVDTNANDCLSSKFSKYDQVDITDEVTKIFQRKKKINFVEPTTLDSFFKYVKMSVEFNLQMNKNCVVKNSLKAFILNNIESIIKHLFDRINVLPLSSSCSMLFLINPFLSPYRKLVVLLDLLMVVDTPSKILFLTSALFNNDMTSFYDKLSADNKNDVLMGLVSSCINEILSHIYCIDTVFYHNNQVMCSYLSIIKSNLVLRTDNPTLFNFLDTLLDLKFQTIIDFDKKSLNNQAWLAGSLVKTICKYLDWDYTYNTLIIEKLKYSDNPFHTLILGMLGFSAYSLLGHVFSVKAVFKEFLFIISDVCEVSYVCYIFIKTFSRDKCEEFLEFYKDSISLDKIELLDEILLY